MGAKERILRIKLAAQQKRIESLVARVQQEITRKSGQWEEDKHPRADDGKFGSGSGQSAEEMRGEGKKPSKKPRPSRKPRRDAEESKPDQAASQEQAAREETAAADYKANGTKAKAFKEWFGDWESDPENASKIIDEDGKPRRVFHGTQMEFAQFDSGKVGSGSGSGLKDTETECYFFTTDPDEADRYASGQTLNDQPYKAEEYPEGAQVLPVYLNIRKPLIAYDAEQGFTPGDIAYFINQAKDNGYDGVVLRNGYAPDSDDDDDVEIEPEYRSDGWQNCIIFKPSQAKSVYNLGTFDPSTDHIRKGITNGH